MNVCINCGIPIVSDHVYCYDCLENEYNEVNLKNEFNSTLIPENNQLRKCCDEFEIKKAGLKKTIEQRDDEIIRLKARLYDLLEDKEY